MREGKELLGSDHARACSELWPLLLLQQSFGSLADVSGILGDWAFDFVVGLFSSGSLRLVWHKVK